MPQSRRLTRMIAIPAVRGRHGGRAPARAAVLVLLVLLGLPPAALGQEGELDELIERSQSAGAGGRLVEQANAEAPSTNDARALTVFYHRRGRARHQLGDYPRAVEDLQLALRHYRPGAAIDGWGTRSRIENDLGSALAGQGRWFEVIEHWQDVARRAGSKQLSRFWYAHLVLSTSYSALRAFPEAEAALRAADDTFDLLRGIPGWAVWQHNWQGHRAAYRARFLHEQGSYAAAEPYWRAALGHAEKDVSVKREHYGATHQNTAAAMSNFAAVMRGLAGNLAFQGKYGEAEVLARQALRRRLEQFSFSSTVVGTALSTLAWTRAQQGDLRGAESYYRHALAAVEASGVAHHSLSLAARRASLGYILVLQSRWEEANRMFELREQGLRSDADQFAHRGVAHASWVVALVRTGRTREAVRIAGGALRSYDRRSSPDAWELAMRRGLLAFALNAAGRHDEALPLFREALPDLTQRAVGADDAEGGYRHGWWQRTILEGYLELLARFHQTGGAPAGLDVADESFRVADLARGSLVQQAITATAARARLPDRELSELARREQDYSFRITALDRGLARLAGAPENERLDKVTAAMRGESARLRAEQAALRGAIRTRFPEYAELVEPRPVGVREFSRMLAPDEAAISIYLGPGESYVWTIGPGGRVSFRVVPVGRAEIDGHVEELRRTVNLEDVGLARLRPFDAARAHLLYVTFFAPHEDLWRGARVLNVIPHAGLAQIPAGLLVTAPPSGAGDAAHRIAQWLIRRVATTQLPSAAAFTALRRAPAARAERRAFIGFGDPLFAAEAGGANGAVVRSLAPRVAPDATALQIESALRAGIAGAQPVAFAVRVQPESGTFPLLNALPDTSDELWDIARALKADPAKDVFVNRQATERNVKQERLDNRRVVAFATHGVAPGEIIGLDQPALVLSNPALTGDTDNDGFLTMEEVLGLKLDADWVVLSACNTASADGRGSEAVSGLGRAFFYAGARSLLVSNWAVETTSARMLTTELFRRQAENPGLTRAEALRQSMLDLMGKTGPGGLNYAHPAFWAPFSLVGDGGR